MKRETLKTLQTGMMLVNKSNGKKIEITEVTTDELKGKDLDTQEVKAYKLNSVRVTFDVAEQPKPEPIKELKRDKYPYIKEMREQLLKDIMTWGNIETKEAKLYTGIYLVANVDEEKQIKKLLCMLYKKTDRVMVQTRPYKNIDTDIIEMNIANGYNGDYQFKIRNKEEMPELKRILQLVFKQVNEELAEQLEELEVVNS